MLGFFSWTCCSSTFGLRPSTFDLRASTTDLRPATFDLRLSTFELRAIKMSSPQCLKLLKARRCGYFSGSVWTWWGRVGSIYMVAFRGHGDLPTVNRPGMSGKGEYLCEPNFVRRREMNIIIFCVKYKFSAGVQPVGSLLSFLWPLRSIVVWTFDIFD